MRITVTDHSTDHIETMDAADLAETIRPWFPGAPVDIDDAINRLQAAVLASDEGERYKARALAEYLHIEIDEHDGGETTVFAEHGDSGPGWWLGRIVEKPAPPQDTSRRQRLALWIWPGLTPEKAIDDTWTPPVSAV